MAIGKSIRPLVIVAGNVDRTRELKRKADQSVYGHEVTVKQHNDALASFTIYDRPGALPVPQIGEYVAVEASVEESRDFGTSLGFERVAFDALDLIQSSLSVSKKAA